MRPFYARFLLGAALLALAPVSADAQFVFRIHDKVYVNGKEYTWEEWQRIKGEGEETETQSPQPQPDPPPPASARAAASKMSVGARVRAASCTSTAYYDEFPGEDQRFQCTLGLGALTREEVLQSGWKIDFVEKIPPVPGKPERSARGLPLHLYKLVISRQNAS